jgi:hypothetical protein
LNGTRNRTGGCRLDPSGSGYGQEAGSCEHGNERSGSIKSEDLVEYLNNCQLLTWNSGIVWVRASRVLPSRI